MSDTIERAQEIYDLCLEQEQKYTFETFSKADALRLGLIMDKVSTFVRNEITRTAPVNIFYFKIKYVFYKVLSYCHLGALSKKMGQRAEKTRKKLRGA